MDILEVVSTGSGNSLDEKSKGDSKHFELVEWKESYIIKRNGQIEK